MSLPNASVTATLRRPSTLGLPNSRTSVSGLARASARPEKTGTPVPSASTATEAVTGVPTRYQSTTPGAHDYAGNNFLMIECRTALPATAHNWTTCTYTDQDGNTGATLPSVTGNSSNIINRLDQPVGTWFCPLASGDSGIKNLTQMQCSASVASGAIDFTSWGVT